MYVPPFVGPMNHPQSELKSILKQKIAHLEQQRSKDKCIKFMMTREQIERDKDRDRLTTVVGHVQNNNNISNRRKKILIRYLTQHIHLYRVGSETDSISDEEFMYSSLDNEYVQMKECLEKFSKTERGSKDEESVLVELFSLHIPGYVPPPDIVDTDPVTSEVNDIGFPFTAPNTVPDTPEYRKRKLDAFTKNINDNNDLTERQKQQFIERVGKEIEPISINGENMQTTPTVMHEIDTGDTPPFRERLRTYSIPLQAIIDKEVETMVKEGIMVPSNSPYATNLILVRKPDASEPTGTKNRVCAAFVKLNDRTVKDRYPLPLIQDIFTRIGNAEWFTTADLLKGFWQVAIKPEHRHKTAVITSRGLFEFVVMAFGLCNAPSTFQRLMDTVICAEYRDFIQTYIDDLVVYSSTFEEHIEHVCVLLRLLKKHKLKVKLSKCYFARRSVKFLGNIISKGKVTINPAVFESIQQWVRPKKGTNQVKTVRSFLGLTGWYRKFIAKYADIVKPLNNLLRKGVKFEWTSECESAFITLRDALMKAPVLVAPDPNKDYVIGTDASLVAKGGVLQQEDENHDLHPIAYWSSTFNPAETRYDTTDREALALVCGLEHFNTLCEGHKYTCVTDHKALIYIIKHCQSSHRLNRLFLRLSPYEIKLYHKPGADNHGPDLLSRAEEVLVINKEVVNTLIHMNGPTRVQRKNSTQQEQQYEVDKILDRRLIDGSNNEYEYYTSFKGYDETHNEWLPLNPNLLGALRKVVDFQKKLDRQRRKQKRQDRYMVMREKCECDQCEYKANNVRDLNLHRFKQHGVRVPIKADLVTPIHDIDIHLMRTMQEKCKEFTLIHAVLKYKQLPDTLTPREKRMLVSNEFVYGEDGLLYCWEAPSIRSKSRVRTQLRLCIPTSQRQRVLSTIHGGALSAHSGIVQTYDTLRDHAWWPSMLKDVIEYVKNCEVCQKGKRAMKKTPSQCVNVPSRPWQSVAVDVIGPFPPTMDGHTHVLVVVDKFTRYAEAFPIKDETTKTIAMKIIECIVCRYGLVTEITSDNGPGFVSHLAQDIYKELGIKRVMTTPHHPQANGVVERLNGTIKNTLKLWCNEEQDNWDVLLPYALFAYNTSFHSFIQEVPHYVNHGWDPLLPVDIATGQRKENHSNVHEYATNIAQQLYDVHKRVGEIMQQVNDDRSEEWEQPQLTTFSVGDEVYLFDPTTYEGLSSKLVNRWKGPYLIIERVSSVNYIILKNDKPQTVHVHRLKKHLTDVSESFMSELEVAEEELNNINATIQQLLKQKEDAYVDLQRIHSEVQNDNSSEPEEKNTNGIEQPEQEEKYDSEGLPNTINKQANVNEVNGVDDAVIDGSKNVDMPDITLSIPSPALPIAQTEKPTVIPDVVNDQTRRRVTRLDVKRAEFEQRLNARKVQQQKKQANSSSIQMRVDDFW